MRIIRDIDGLKIHYSKDEITNLDQRITEHLDQLEGGFMRIIRDIDGLKIHYSKDEITNLDQRLTEHLDHLGK